MATLPNPFRRSEISRQAPAPSEHTQIHAARDPYMLRPLPGEDLRLEFKPINNSRLVRDPDPRSRGACWSAIATTAIALVFLAGVLAPRVLNTLAGMKLEALRGENRRLVDESIKLDLKVAELTSPQHLEELARHQNLVVPHANQVVHLNGPSSGDGNVAMIH